MPSSPNLYKMVQQPVFYATRPVNVPMKYNIFLTTRNCKNESHKGNPINPETRKHQLGVKRDLGHDKE